MVNGMRREMGFGCRPDVSIAEAREQEFKARRILHEGLNPIAERSKPRYQPERVTVQEALEGCFQGQASGAQRRLDRLTVDVAIHHACDSEN